MNDFPIRDGPVELNEAIQHRCGWSHNRVCTAQSLADGRTIASPLGWGGFAFHRLPPRESAGMSNDHFRRSEWEDGISVTVQVNDIWREAVFELQQLLAGPFY